MEILTNVLLWFSVISIGVMAGVYFTFSAFVMRSLDAIEAPAGMMAMQSINRVILKSTFLPIFFLSTASCAILMGIALLDFGAPAALWTLGGSAVYVVGMFVVTVAGNVPLNNKLEETPANGPDGPEMWKLYLAKWTIWNHIRTFACTASMALLVLAVSIRM